MCDTNEKADAAVSVFVWKILPCQSCQPFCLAVCQTDKGLKPSDVLEERTAASHKQSLEASTLVSFFLLVPQGWKYNYKPPPQ